MDSNSTPATFVTDENNQSTTDDNFTTCEAEIDIPLLAQSHFYFKASLIVNNYYGMALVVTGLIGNTLSLLVMLQPQNKKLPCCLYLATLAVTDNLFIINCLELVLMMGFFPDHFKDIHCTIVVYHAQVCGVISSFIITGVTLERYLAICFPLKSAPWRTIKHAKMIIGGICVFSIFFNIPYVFTAGLSYGLLCAGVSCSTFWCKVWSWAGFTVNFVIPFLALMTMNFLIVRAIRKRGKYFKKQMQSERQKTVKVKVSVVQCEDPANKERTAGKANGSVHDTKEKKDKSPRNPGETSKDAQLTAMLLLVTTCFLIFTSPIYIRFIFFANYNILKDVETFAKVSLLYQCTQKSFFTNSAINFFLYCIAGSKFRRDCIGLFCKSERVNQNSARSMSGDSSSALEDTNAGV